MPTIKQKAAFQEITENHRSVSDAMRVVGYDPDTASKPKNLTASKGWQELVEQYLPDSLLAQKHNEFLNDEERTIGIKALDLAYKLKGSYAPDKSLNLNINADLKQDPKTREIGAKYEAELLNTLTGETE